MLERLFPQQSDDKLMVEDCFSCFLYTGNGSTQTITNGIDLAGKGGMLWRKSRGVSENHFILDTTRGIASYLESNTTSAAVTGYNWIASFNSDGFTNNNNSANSGTYASWTFRKAPKFFDVVTFSSNGAGEATFNHSLGTTPGVVIIKATGVSEAWLVYHRSLANTNGLFLNTTDASTNFGVGANWLAPTDTNVAVKALGASRTYVAYLFAHDPSADGIIQCGSFTANSGNDVTTTLGWEPQWFLVKGASVASSWFISDTMRGFVSGEVAGTSDDAALLPASSSAEIITPVGSPTATGFQTGFSGFGTYIYVAIRRGPMRTPTLGTSVFQPVAATQGLNTTTPATSSITDDLFISSSRPNSVQFNVGDRLRGSPFMFTQGTGAETSGFYDWGRQTGVQFLNNLTTSNSLIMYHFRRAPGFMDVVCYTGNGVAGRTVNHNLSVAPELIIVKGRNNAGTNWLVYAAPSGPTQSLFLNLNNQTGTYPYWNNTTPTATVFTVGSSYDANTSGGTYVAYLFASVPGVSKVGSYTGNGSSQTINCGFTNGARFILIKRTDSAGNWCVWDSARGIVAGDDPVLSLNNTFAEDNTTDDVDPHSTGFIVNRVSPGREINLNGGTYIYLAIA